MSRIVIHPWEAIAILIGLALTAVCLADAIINAQGSPSVPLQWAGGAGILALILIGRRVWTRNQDFRDRS